MDLEPEEARARYTLKMFGVDKSLKKAKILSSPLVV